MKREKIFSTNGFYKGIVQSNVLLHSDAVSHGKKIVSSMLQKRRSDEPILILDLACGAMPISVSDIMDSFSDFRFKYTGIDINPDQVEYANTVFKFPDNVAEINVIEGNAWNLPKLGISDRKFDIIYSGLNTHHGTPEELYFLALQLHSLLHDHGVFMNHDWIRPLGTPYLRRPDFNPYKSSESFQLIKPDLLTDTAIPEFGFMEESWSETLPEWKASFIDDMCQVLKERGASAEQVAETRGHVSLRDYPMSIEEEKSIFNAAGFKTVCLDYNSSKEPLKKWFAMYVMSHSD